MSSLNEVEPTRHVSVFSPAAFGSRQIHIVGCGATGSRIAMEVAKLGISDLHLWDFDKIESHNIANQLFGRRDIGRQKVEALAERIWRDTGLRVTQHDEAVTPTTKLRGVVFLLTDTMKSRKEIWEGAIKPCPWVEVMIETRMGKDEGRVYAVRPADATLALAWEKTLYADEESAESLCGARTTVGPTAALIQAHAVWAMIRWFKWYQDSQNAFDFETLLTINPPMVVTYTP